MSSIRRIEEITYHRNGVSGAPFYVVNFRNEDNAPMIGVVFDVFDEDDSMQPPFNRRTAVLNRELVGEGTIAFGVNSWRGDRYDADLRSAIAAYERRYDEAVAS